MHSTSIEHRVTLRLVKYQTPLKFNGKLFFDFGRNLPKLFTRALHLQIENYFCFYFKFTVEALCGFIVRRLLPRLHY